MKSLNKIFLVVGGSLLVILAILFAIYGPVFISLAHNLWAFFRQTWVSVALIVAFGVCVTLFWKATSARDSLHYARNSDSEELSNAKSAQLKSGVAGIAIAVAILASFSVVSYFQKTAMLNDTEVIATTDAESLSFDERVPFDVAKAVSDRSLGDTSGNSTGTVKSIPSSGEYTTSVIRRGIFQGYESVQTMNLPLHGAANTNSDVTFCKYSEDAGLRLGGAGWGNSLDAKIYMKTSPSTLVDSGSAVAVCETEGDKSIPMLYVPLTKMEGFLTPHVVPAGVAIYNGSTGELKIEQNIENANVSVYPESVARAQREALTADSGYMDYLFKRAGFDTTNKDADDPNAGNNTEFAMRTADDKETLYVTPLTPRGSSSSIVGLATVDSNTVEKGNLNPLTVHRYEEGKTRDANSTIAATIISTTLEGYKANGLTVFEVVPANDGTWTASIGRDQSILYRANISSDGHTVTLIDANGRATVGNLGEGPADSAPEGTEAVGNDEALTATPVDQMSPEQLKELIDQLTAELADRAAQNNG